MRKFTVKHFKDNESVTAFIDKSLGRRKAMGIQTTSTGFVVCY